MLAVVCSEEDNDGDGLLWLRTLRDWAIKATDENATGSRLTMLLSGTASRIEEGLVLAELPEHCALQDFRA